MCERGRSEGAPRRTKMCANIFKRWVFAGLTSASVANCVGGVSDDGGETRTSLLANAN